MHSRYDTTPNNTGIGQTDRNGKQYRTLHAVYAERDKSRSLVHFCFTKTTTGKP